MNKHFLQTRLTSNGTAYLLLLIFGAHYAYLGKWGVQILYWFTLGGFGIWLFIDLFMLSGKVSRHNAAIFQEIEEIEKKEKKEEHARNMAMMAAVSGRKNSED